MKRTAGQSKSSNAKNADSRLRRSIHLRLKELLNVEKDNPVVKAKTAWQIVSEQLRFVLGNEIHAQWFQKARPIVLSNKILIIQTETVFASQWITNHYQELAENLLKAQDKDYSCFFISPKNTIQKRRF